MRAQCSLTAYARRFAACPPYHATRRWQAWCLTPPTGLWMCASPQCRAVSSITTPTCPSCCAPQPAVHSWTCGSCRRSNPDSVRFCRKCATPYATPSAWLCPCCGAPNDLKPDAPNGAECAHCAYSLRPISPRPPQPYVGEIAAKPSETHSNTGGKEPDDTESPSMAGPPAPPLPPPSVDPIDVRRLGPPGFAWLCREPDCGVLNDGNTVECAGCNVVLRPGPWGCGGCGSMNHPLRSRCFSCNAAIPPSWLCLACRGRTSVYDMRCSKCGEERPPPSSTAPQVGGHRFGRAGDWLCPTCRKLNHANRDVCFSCETPKPSADEMSGTAGRITPVGDSNWTCPGCRAVNFRTRSSCWQCGVVPPRAQGAAVYAATLDKDSRPSIAKEGFQQPSDKDGTVASAPRKVWMATDEQLEDSDWVCAKCTHKNFRTQKDCYRCFTPKTVAPVSRVVVKPRIRNHKL